MKEKISFEYLLNVSPEKAIEYLEQKGYKITKDWREIWKEANNRAFTISGVMKEDILRDVKESLIRNIQEGKGFEGFKKNLQNLMQVKGWNINNWRLKTIYSTNMDIAYSIGRFEEQWAVKYSIPYWQYITMNDEKVRPAHAALHGKVFKSTDPIWKIIYPPNGFNCRCVVRNYTKQEFKKLDLKLSNSKGKIEKVIIEVGSGQNKRKVQAHAYDGNIIDVGWDYNPGMEFRVKK